MNPAPSSAIHWSELTTERAPAVGERRWARRLCQAMVLLPLFGLILLPEYVQGLGDPESKSILYRETIGPLRLVDALLLAVVAVHVVAWGSSRRLRVDFPRELRLPGIGFLVAIGLAMIYGDLHGGTNLFFDWRALALGIGIYGVFALWLQTHEQVTSSLELFVGFMTVRIAMIYAEFLRDGGDLIMGVRIPVFDGPTLSALVFTAILAVCLSDFARGWSSVLWTFLGGASYLLVLLCFRRTFWAVLGIATLLLLLLQTRRRGRKLVVAAAAFAAVTAMLGPAFYERVQSMDFTQDDTEFSQGNPDHVGEVLDAWEQVQQSPLMGIGLGRSFPTFRIQEWKSESVMVHNAPLHVWLKYGLLGLTCYLWFHFALFRWLHRRRGEFRNQLGSCVPRLGQGQVSPPSLGLAEQQCSANRYEALVVAALAYLAAQFAVSLGFTPWPYSSLQSTILIAFLLALAIRGAKTWDYQPSPSLLLR